MADRDGTRFGARPIRAESSSSTRWRALGSADRGQMGIVQGDQFLDTFQRTLCAP
jgi:hypothetical protein